jgi:hypothetical protein
MGRKSSAKDQRQATGAGTQGAPPKAGKGPGALILVGVIVLALGVGGYVIWSHNAAVAAADAAAAQAATEKADAAQMVQSVDFAKKMTALGPHHQASYPPIPYQDFAPPRPVQTVDAAFQFAAEHPEVLSYIPCFCGCQHMGHRGNEDCFVKSRAANGDVTEWEPHGVECQVCIDVATRARQMTASGASVDQIRTAVEKEFKANFQSETPTPPAPSH